MRERPNCYQRKYAGTKVDLFCKIELRYKARETIDVIGKTFGRPSHILAATLASFILCMQCIRCYSQELRYKARETIDVIGKTFGRPSHVLELTSSSYQYYLDHAMAICENDQTAISANMQEPRLTYSATCT